MNGFQPDRKPQQMAQMLAMQERNRSLNGPGNNMRNVPQPNLMYAGGTPNTNPGVPPQMMNFNGPPQSRQGGMPLGYGAPLGGTGNRGMAPPAPGGMSRGMSPQIGGNRPRGPGAVGYPASPGMTTPQGGRYRGDFDNGAE